MAQNEVNALILAGIAAISTYVYVASHAARALARNIEDALGRRKNEIDIYQKQKLDETTRELIATERESVAKLERLAKQINERQALLSEAQQVFSVGFLEGRRWLASYISDALKSADEKVSRELEDKKYPALRAAEEVRRAKQDRRDAIQRIKFLEYEIATLKEYFPIIEEYEELILSERIDGLDNNIQDDNFDRAQLYLTKEDYERLPAFEKYQRALDRYIAKPKNSYEIGRAYERYIGYRYESAGWDTIFQGALEGKADLGRDLVCRKSNIIHVVQAKCWSREKMIREKHIFQLYGTTVLMKLKDDQRAELKAIFVTTTKLSETARKAAEYLNVEVQEIPANSQYPMVKGNVNGKEKIYHLPFDQQYDRVKISQEGEGYFGTVAEAEARGFRRAMKFRGKRD